MITAFALVRNLTSGATDLRFQEFRLWEIRQGCPDRLANARAVFPGAYFDDWIYERDYPGIPARAGCAPSGFGRIPDDVEDALLLLRLFKPGDLAFASAAVRESNGKVSKQYPYRAISDLVGASPFPYELDEGECAPWDAFARDLMASPSWESTWFGVARRFFLYGGGKEFNPYSDEVDRIVDYMIALEAALVPERDFVSRRLRERAARILQANGQADPGTIALMRDCYGVRSTIAHGGALSDDQRTLVRTKRQAFEAAVRQILAATLRTLPAGDHEHQQALAARYDISDDVRVAKLVEDFRAIKTNDAKAQAVQSLAGQAKPPQMEPNGFSSARTPQKN